MDFLKKNKLVVGLIAVIVVVLGLGFVVMGMRGQAPTTTPGDQTQVAKKLSPDDIGLELSLREDNKAVNIKVTKLEGIKSLEYELTYLKEEEIEGELHNVDDGVLGDIEVEGESEIDKEIVLGTCSATCRYHTVKSDINVLLRVNFENGEIGEVEDTIALPQEEE